MTRRIWVYSGSEEGDNEMLNYEVAWRVDVVIDFWEIRTVSKISFPVLLTVENCSDLKGYYILFSPYSPLSSHPLTLHSLSKTPSTYKNPFPLLFFFCVTKL